MKKLLRLLSSRYFLAVLCILLEFAQLTAVFLFLKSYFWPTNLLGWLLQLVVLLYIINRDEIPEFKLPWVIILLLFPVAGALLFLLFADNSASRKQRRRYGAITEALRPYAAQTDALEALRARDGGAARQAQYLHAAANAPCYRGTAVTYYPLGEDFHPALLEALESAERFIFMEYFVIQEGRMWDPIHAILKQKAARGVAVYVMYDDLGCMNKLSGKYYELLRDEGIHAVPAGRLRPVFTRSHNNRDHRKLTVVDGRVGFTGGLNLSDRYMNAETVFGHWKDSAVRLEGPAVRTLTALFLTSWHTQTGEPVDCVTYMEPVQAERDARGFTVPFGDGPPPLYPDRIGKNVYLGILYDARDYVYVTTPYLICDHELLSALRIAARRGVDVRIITPHIPDKKTVFLLTRSNYLPLVRDGVKIYEYTPGFIHAKSFVCDDSIATVGTVNLDYRSLYLHFECGVWMYNTPCIADIRRDYLETLEKCTPIPADYGRDMPLTKRLVRDFLRLFAPLM